MSRNLRIAAFALAAAVGAVALAYVLPASAILRRVSDQRDELRLFNLRVDGTASFFAESAAEAGSALSMPSDRGDVQSDASISFKVPGRCRMELTPLEGTRSAAILSGSKTRQEGKAVAAMEIAVAEVCALLAMRSESDGDAKAALDRHLRQRGVEVGAQTWLARFGGEVAYVIGKREQGAAQMWVYKDSFLPARVQFRSVAQGPLWDVRFFDFTSPVTGEWFPRTVEVVRDGKLAMRFTALASDSRSKLDDKLF
ncbi:MAG: hypothetical protein M3Y59_02410 [Myxococcota bacterium]|nr:hypothetical protein [Myxococcota bacterium]